MEIETDVGGLVVRMAGNPAEAAAYVAALAMMSNGHGVQAESESEPVVEPAPDAIVPELFPMEPKPAARGRSPRALAAVPNVSPQPAPAPDPGPPDLLSFHVSNMAYEAIKATGVDVSIFDKGKLQPNGPGYSWMMELNADDAVSLYVCINAGVEKGAGRKVPGVYTVRRKLEAALDHHFGIHN